MKNLISIFVILTIIIMNNGLMAQNPCIPVCPVKPTPMPELIPTVNPPVIFTDCDNNGIPDSAEGSGNTDNTGLPDNCDPDNDDDGVLDQYDLCPTVPGTSNGCPNEADQWRQVFYVHGMKGTEESWARVRAWTASSYKSFAPEVEYENSQQSMQTATASLADKIRTKLQAPEPLWKKKRNFIIAHSLGGVVSRHLQLHMDNSIDNMPFDGIVTFGSPHLGAKAADNKINKPWIYESFLNESCKKIGGAFARSIVSENGVLSLMSPFLKLGSKINETCDKLSGLALNVAESSMSAGVEAELTTANSATYPVPSTRYNLAVYGVENPTAMFARYIGTNLKKINDSPLFGAAETDQLGIDAFDDLKESILSKLLNNTGEPITPARKAAFKACAEALEFISRIDPTYKSLIGAFETQVVSSQLYCHRNTQSGTTVTPISSYYECTCNQSQGCYSSYITTDVTYTTVLKESDAFVLAESAAGMPNVIREAVKMDGSNHFQMRNDENTRMVLQDNLFLGNYGGYFFINTK